MKIKQLFLKNFASVNEIKIEYNQDVTYLIGQNGSGKSLCGLTSVWTCLLGLAKKGKDVLHPDRFRFIGNYGKSAIIQLVLHDEVEKIDITISRKLLKNKTELKITASDKRQLPDNFIDDIFNIFSINPLGFSKLSPQEQATTLGIDTSMYDQLIKDAYSERHELGRDVKRLQGAADEIGVVEEVEPVNLKKLLQKKEQIEKENYKLTEKARAERDEAVQEVIKYNQKEDDKHTDIKDIDFLIENAKGEIEETEEDLEELQKKIEQFKLELKASLENHKKLIVDRELLPAPAEKKSTDIPVDTPDLENTSALDLQIESAEATNQQATRYQQSLEAQHKLKSAEKLHAAKQAEMNNIESDRIEYIKSCNLPFSNITIDDAGGVLINDRPFSETYFSKGEILRIGIKLAASSNPKLKYVFVPDSQSIDKENREKLFAELVEAGFQVVAEFVDTERQKDHGSILLKESKVVESYDEEENDLNSL